MAPDCSLEAPDLDLRSVVMYSYNPDPDPTATPEPREKMADYQGCRGIYFEFDSVDHERIFFEDLAYPPYFDIVIRVLYCDNGTIASGFDTSAGDGQFITNPTHNTTNEPYGDYGDWFYYPEPIKNNYGTIIDYNVEAILGRIITFDPGEP